MDCPTCQHPNRGDARFCGQCGSPLKSATACPACGRANAPGQRFCDGCGTRLAEGLDPRTYTPKHLADKILTTRAAVEGERKHVTVLFADVADYTALAERVDPEEMHSLMNRCFQIILEQVHGFEGTVNQFTGDGVMALFGAPIALEDAPRRALMAALAIQRALVPFGLEVSEKHGRGFRMRIGVHSGMVVVGRIGDDLRMDYTAVGDTTNLANRLQQVARPGSVVLSDATQRLTSGFFEVRDLGEITVKGRSSPLHAYELSSERAVSGRVEAASGLTPLVGRDRDLEHALRAFESAELGNGQLVFVVGEAGIGKSRLLYELRSRLRDRPHAWMEGHCTSYGRTTPFHPIADALRRRFGIQERDDDATALEKLERAERDAGGELAWTLPFVRSLLALPVGDARIEALDAATRRSETFRALQARFVRAAALAPFVLVIEDLHWIDPASEELLAFLAESVPALRVLLLVTHRPGYRQPFGDRSYHVRLALQPLSERDTTTIASRVLESSDLPEDLRLLIARKAEGNPFFIEEVTKSLLEEGALRRVDGRVELARSVASITVPDSIQDVIMARLDRLADEPKRAIQIASVIGREFALRLLERTIEVGERAADLVGELRALELIYQKATHPELAYMFKHALTHDVAYASVLVQRRKALHRLVGVAIEELYADRLTEHFEGLAHHFELAEEWDKALAYHEKAADKAWRAYANHAAADHYRRALAIADRLGARISDQHKSDLHRGLGAVCFSINEFRQGAESFRHAAELDSDLTMRAVCLSHTAWSYHWGHEYALAERAIADARELSDANSLAVGRAMADMIHGFVRATTQGDVEAMESSAVDAARACPGNPMIELRSAFFRAEVAEWNGDFRKAERLFGEVVGAVSATQDPALMTHAEWFAGKAACCLGNYGDALTRLHEGADRAFRVGDRAMQSRLLNTLGWCYAEIGCHRIGVEFNARATEIGRELVELELVAGAPELYGNAAINLALDRMADGELDRADDTLAPIREDLERSTDPWMRWRYSLHVLHADALLALARGDADRALALTAREREGARRHRAAKIEARAVEMQGRILATMDRREEAERDLAEALALAGRIAYPPVAWRTRALLAELCRRRGDRAAAEAFVGETRALVARCSRSLADQQLRSELVALGERLILDPLAAR